MAQEQERCDGCRFYDGYEVDAAGIDLWGVCRRYPPVLAANTVEQSDRADEIAQKWKQPEIVASDWCGEFQPANVAAAANQKTSLIDLKEGRRAPFPSVRTINVLLAEGVEYMEDAQAMSDNELRRMPNLGMRSLKEIRAWRPTQPASPPPDGR